MDTEKKDPELIGHHIQLMAEVGLMGAGATLSNTTLSSHFPLFTTHEVNTRSHRTVLRTLALTAVVFFTVSGGPY